MGLAVSGFLARIGLGGWSCVALMLRGVRMMVEYISLCGLNGAAGSMRAGGMMVMRVLLMTK